MQPSLVDKIFRDSTGQVVIAQPPNLPLWVWLVATLLQLVTGGVLYQTADAIAFGALFTWAWLELFEGVNYFRRSLGLVALIVAIALRVQTP